MAGIVHTSVSGPPKINKMTIRVKDKQQQQLVE